MTNAARMARWYRRRRAGKAIYQLELDTGGVEDLLTAAWAVVAAGGR